MHTLRRLGIKFPTLVIAVLAIWTFIWVDARGQAPAKDSPLRTEGYILPPKIILDAIPGAYPEERLLYTNICPDGKKFLVTKGTGMPSVENMARPAVHLGDTAFDHTANRSHGLYAKSNSGYELFFYADKRTVPVEIPAKARVTNPVWSPDGSQLAFFVHSYDATHIYVADTNTGKSRKITPIPVQATLVTNFNWTGDGKRIQAVLAPDDGTRRFPFNENSTGPMVRVTDTKAQQARTIRYLMETPHDMKLLEHLITGQLAVIDVANGKITNVGKPAMLKSVNASPGADSYRVATMDKKSFSFNQTFASFPSSEGLWNSEGKQVYSFKKAGAGKGGKKKGDPDPDPDPDKQQKKDAEPKDDPEGKRDLGWRPDGVGMSYLKLEAAKKDSKDPRKDYVMQWLAPWNETSNKVVYESKNPITSVQYNDDCSMMFLTVTAENSRQIIAVDLKDEKRPTWVVYKGAAPGGELDPVLDADVNADDTSVDPWDYMAASNAAEQKGAKGGKGGDKGGGVGPAGGLMTRSRGSAKVVRISSTEDVYVSGSDKGKPFIDKIAIKTGKKSRIFTGKGEMSESIDTVNGDDITIVFTNGQKRTVPPNTYMNELATGKVTKMTNNVDHTPWFHELKTERVQITREDGFKFWAKVTTSPNVKKKAPSMFWFYPKEFTDQAAYNGKGAGGKAAGGGGKAPNDNAKYAAPGTRSMSILTVLGYAVVEPDCPIVGPAGKMNDNYVKDLKSNLQATVDELAKLEFIDPDRLALGGHSYGAFSTANAMVHTKLFKAGIAGDGCYNRTLTPMSFQTEKRNIWQAMDTYLAMSPFLNADKMSGALLMYHGAWDRNVGTNPINSERMFAALKGLGKPCALYMYPYEDHGPVGKETQLDMWARWVAWLDLYVMNAKTEEKK